MTFIYWIAVFVCIIAFGGMTNNNGKYKKFDRIWVPLFIISLITAIVLSGDIIAGVITGIVLFFGNGIFWAIFWGPLNVNGTRMPRFMNLRNTFVKKSIDKELSKRYFTDFIDSIFSEKEIESHNEKLSRLKRDLPILKLVNQECFNDNLTAVNLALLRLSWTKFRFKKLGVDGIDDLDSNNLIENIIVSTPKSKKYENLYKEYSNMLNEGLGITGISEAFIKNILENKVIVTQKETDGLLGTFNWFFSGTEENNRKHFKETGLI